MTTHSDIIKRAGTPAAILEKIGSVVSVHTVTSWRQRNSIPAEHWKVFCETGLATLEELAVAAAERPSSRAQDAA
jgi:hypothetical protein